MEKEKELKISISKKVERYTANYIDKLNSLSELDDYIIHINIIPRETTRLEPTMFISLEEMRKWEISDKRPPFVTIKTLDGNAYNHQGKLTTTAK